MNKKIWALIIGTVLGIPIPSVSVYIFNLTAPTGWDRLDSILILLGTTLIISIVIIVFSWISLGAYAYRSLLAEEDRPRGVRFLLIALLICVSPVPALFAFWIGVGITNRIIPHI